ncbi:MAG: 4-hydroxy-tetrahydrodipicolinate synthase, partial [Clostridia bacterium]|nr:4-hydroxy-tetrahydrodipicolinate synthase [Clostridia bacterium]
MKKPLFTGSAVALITPFNESGVDYKKFEELIEFHIANKTDALVVCATTGESSTMSDAEHREALKFAADIAKGRIILIAGTGSNDTNYAISLSSYAESVGYDGLLLVTPYYNKATQKGLYLHFKAIADSVNIPIILYNIPGRTGCMISLDTFKKLDKIPHIIGVKEATGDLAFAGQIAANTDLVLYSGNDDVILPMMAIGGQGVISVIANILP